MKLIQENTSSITHGKYVVETTSTDEKYSNIFEERNYMKRKKKHTFKYGKTLSE